MAEDDVKRSEVFSKSDGSNFTCSVSCAQRLLLGLIILKQDTVKNVEDKWKKGFERYEEKPRWPHWEKRIFCKENLELWAFRLSFANSLPRILLAKCQTVKSRGSVQLQMWGFRWKLTSLRSRLTKTASPLHSPVFYIITCLKKSLSRSWVSPYVTWDARVQNSHPPLAASFGYTTWTKHMFWS